MTHDQMIEVIQAHKEGKEIEFRYRTMPNAHWQLATIGPLWAFDEMDYRVKKEPRTRWMIDVVDRTNGRPYYTKGFMSKEKVDQYLARHREGRYWTVTEPYEVVERT